MLALLNDPKNTQTNGEWVAVIAQSFKAISVSGMQLELCDMMESESRDIDTAFYTSPLAKEKYPCIVDLAIRVLSIFGSTYLCESLFSNMNHVKNQKRTSLTDNHLTDLLRIANADIKDQDYERIMATKHVFHTSH